MYPLSLTDWDCFLIENAILAHVSNDISRPNGNKLNRHLVKAYMDVIKQKHHVNWSNSTRKALLNYVSNLSSYNKIHDIGLSYGYNSHNYRALLGKLRISINHQRTDSFE